jgi:hypothetical protein
MDMCNCIKWKNYTKIRGHTPQEVRYPITQIQLTLGRRKKKQKLKKTKKDLKTRLTEQQLRSMSTGF